MEANATLGLAANILQFVDFGNKILSKGNEIYTSADGTLMENVTIEAVVSHLKNTLGRLHAYPMVRSAVAQRLQNECNRLINDILGALDKVKYNGSPSKWKSHRKALKHNQQTVHRAARHGGRYENHRMHCTDCRHTGEDPAA
jgi:hypothetical protein